MDISTTAHKTSYSKVSFNTQHNIIQIHNNVMWDSQYFI